MSAYSRLAPWSHRSALHIVAAPAARLLRWLVEERVPYDYREIERYKLELEMKKANVGIVSRFKVM